MKDDEGVLISSQPICWLEQMVPLAPKTSSPLGLHSPWAETPLDKAFFDLLLRNLNAFMKGNLFGTQTDADSSSRFGHALRCLVADKIRQAIKCHQKSLLESVQCDGKNNILSFDFLLGVFETKMCRRTCAPDCTKSFSVHIRLPDNPFLAFAPKWLRPSNEAR